MFDRLKERRARAKELAAANEDFSKEVWLALGRAGVYPDLAIGQDHGIFDLKDIEGYRAVRLWSKPTGTTGMDLLRDDGGVEKYKKDAGSKGVTGREEELIRDPELIVRLVEVAKSGIYNREETEKMHAKIRAAFSSSLHRELIHGASRSS
jgi:hypothetical protein